MNDFARSPRVLVVEDDDEIALALQRSLRMEGYDVRLAGDGVDALDPARVRAARVPHAQRAHRGLAPAPPRRGLGVRPVLDHEHDRGVRVQPAKEARSRWRAPAPTYDPRRRLRPPRIGACRSAGAWPAAPRS